MKISHEIPFVYLENSLEFNDYDYLLPHLYDKHPEYKDFFIRDNHKQHRYIIMDNSLHELGVPYSKGRMISIIEEVKPDEFIVPDAWENSIKSMRNAKEWSFIELPEGVTKVAVVQGKSFSEVVKCYQTYKWSKDRIHLLGCSLPQEFLYYQDIKQIESIDTSNPIMAAFDGTTYSNWGLGSKPKTKIDEVVNLPFDEEVYTRIKHNVYEFKLINNIK